LSETILEKVGETKTDNLIQDCYKIYRESFDKLFPDYFEKNHLKAIAFVTTHDKDSSEIKKIGMSVPDDLLTKQFAQWLSGLLGGVNGSSPENAKTTAGATNTPMGNSHGGSNFSCWGTKINSIPIGLRIDLGNGTDVPLKDDFNSNSMFQGLLMNIGTFNSGLGSVTWSASGTAIGDNTIRQTDILARWKNNINSNVQNWLLAWDIINPVVPILLAETVNVEYKLVFS